MIILSVIFAVLLISTTYMIYKLTDALLERFANLRRSLHFAVCFAGAAVFFIAVCVTGVLSFISLRNADYLKGYDTGYAEANAVLAININNAPNVYNDESVDDTDNNDKDDLINPRQDDNKNIPDNNDNKPEDSINDSNEVTDLPDGDVNTDDESGDEIPVDPDDNPVTQNPPTGITVYYTPTGSVLHKNRSCSYLKNSKEILECDAADAPNLKPCSRCG